MRASAACRCISTTRRRCKSPASVPTILAQSTSRRGICFVQELVEEGKVSIHYVKSEDQQADLGTKHLSKHRHRKVIKLINEFENKA